jgi:hypothetical protein
MCPELRRILQENHRNVHVSIRKPPEYSRIHPEIIGYDPHSLETWIFKPSCEWSYDGTIFYDF